MNDRSSQVTDPSQLQMSQLILGFMATQAIHVAAKLGIADLVGETPKTADELALATQAHGPSLQRLLRMLTGVGIFTEDEAGRFQHTPLSETLRMDHPQSLRNVAIMWGAPFIWRPWGELYEAVRTGQPAFDHVYGASAFEYLTAHADEAAIFNAATTSISSLTLSALLAAYDFSGFERIVDVGGGQGALLHGILSAHPKLRGVLFDLPAVVAGAAAVRTGALAERCEVVGGDFFQAVPAGADAYVMKYIIHDWNDEDAVQILRNCRRAIRPGGKLLLIEMVLKPSNEPDPGRYADVNMLVLLRGRERSEAEFRALLREAGFSLTRVIATSALYGESIIESQPI
jgi:SAM-dependent methyltransferase